MRTILATVLLLTASVANAQLGTGSGSQTCGKFAQDHKRGGQSIENMYYSWAQGFMTGENMNKEENDPDTYHDLSGTSTDNQKAYLRKYCNDHPSEKYIDAVFALFNSLPVRSIPQEAAAPARP